MELAPLAPTPTRRTPDQAADPEDVAPVRAQAIAIAEHLEYLEQQARPADAAEYPDPTEQPSTAGARTPTVRVYALAAPAFDTLPPTVQQRCWSDIPVQMSIIHDTQLDATLVRFHQTHYSRPSDAYAAGRVPHEHPDTGRFTNQVVFDLTPGRFETIEASEYFGGLVSDTNVQTRFGVVTAGLERTDTQQLAALLGSYLPMPVEPA